MSKENENNNEDKSIIQNSDIIPSAISNALNEIPDEEAKEKVKKSILMSISAFNMVGKPSTPFDKVLTQEHCTQFLKNMEESDKRDFADKKSSRKYTFFTICIALLFITVIVFLFLNYGKSELIKDILIPILTFLGGVWGGYGYGFKNGKLSQQ